VQKTVIDLASEKGRGIPALSGSSVPAVFSDAVRIQLGECTLLYLSGKIGVDAQGRMGRTIREQTKQILENLKALMTREGGTMDDIVRVRVYVTQIDAESLRDVHDVRSSYWTPGNYPASTLVRVSQFVRDGALIEIDADAVIARR
jgi:enamine deaminase RidA (YjgF/YER057c/UK114 family)